MPATATTVTAATATVIAAATAAVTATAATATDKRNNTGSGIAFQDRHRGCLG